MSHLVLSLFPGIDLLGRAFEEVGFCVVRGPDLLWGGDIKTFHPPAGKFDGVIGGPPCQAFSQLNKSEHQATAPNLIPEFERIVGEALPTWFLMENVKQAPEAVVEDYGTTSVLLNNRWVGADQNRVRRFTFGNKYRAGVKLRIDVAVLESIDHTPCVTANGFQWERDGQRGRYRSDRSRKALARYVKAQGLPDDFLEDAPFTVAGKVKVVGNGVPLPMGRAVARAVQRATRPPAPGADR